MSVVPRLRSVADSSVTLLSGLSSSVWVLEAGALVNALGSGFVAPFAVIYLHNIRGFGLGESAAIVALISAVGIVSGPVAGTAADRLTPRIVLGASLVLMAIGYVGFPFVRAPWQAFGLALVAGAGNGSFYPSQSSLIGGLVPPERRHVGFSLQRVMANLGYGIGGLLGGFVATTAHPASFNILFFVNAGTYLAFVAVLRFVADPAVPEDAAGVPGSYRSVLSDRTFLGLLVINAALITGGYSLFDTLEPAYAKNTAGVPNTLIGALFLVNTVVIVIGQLPITRLAEGRRRMRMLALLGGLWALAVLVVLAGGTLFAGVAAGAVMMLAAAVFALGECLQGTIVSATAADLAPARQLSRYMAMVSFTWQLGLGLGPAAGGYLLEAYPPAVWVLGALLCLAGGAGALALEPRMAERHRRTPRSARPLGAAAAGAGPGPPVDVMPGARPPG